MVTTKYKHWNIVEEMPDGWREDKTVGSPLSGHIVISNGKSILNGGQRALLRIKEAQYQRNTIATVKQKLTIKKEDDEPEVVIDENYVKTVNELARKKFEHRLLQDIMTDLMICDIEGWDKQEYIKELKQLISSIGKQRKKQNNPKTTQLFFNFDKENYENELI